MVILGIGKRDTNNCSTTNYYNGNYTMIDL